MKDNLLRKIERGEAVVGVIGLGYVGLPLLYGFVDQGFTAIGFDIDSSKVDHLNRGESYIHHIPSERVAEGRATGRVHSTTDFSELTKCDAVLIAVPTPLGPNREPDMSYIEATCETISGNMRKGQIFILESTTYPGTTREVVIPALERSGLRAHEDFLAAYSPEREDPNNPDFTTRTIPKVVGATSADGLEVASALYGKIVNQVVPVSTAEVAEATKLLENVFRAVNIALVNELKVTFMEMGIDMGEVIAAASTKPFGFMPFYPGPGLGGHCIPIDPFYLAWKAREFGVTTRFIELAGEINTAMPNFVVRRIMEVLNEQGKAVKNAKILILGLAYKPNVDDDRESPSYPIMERLEDLGAQVHYNDPHIPTIRPTRKYARFGGRQSVEISADYDLILLVTAHDEYLNLDVAALNRPIVDTRGVLADSDFVHRA